MSQKLIDRLQVLCACAYQLAGYHDAPEVWLDALSDAAMGVPLRKWRVQGDLIETLLPYCPTAQAVAVDEAMVRSVARAYALRRGWEPEDWDHDDRAGVTECKEDIVSDMRAALQAAMGGKP